MSDKLLKALMQLFAILADNERYSHSGKRIVEHFLKQQISPSARSYFLEVFENHLQQFSKEREGEFIAQPGLLTKERLKKISGEINRELKIREKYIVLIRLIEFSVSCCDTLTDEEKACLRSVAHTFNISSEDYEICFALTTLQENEIPDHSCLMVLSADQNPTARKLKQLQVPFLEGKILLAYIRYADIIFLRYFENQADLLTLNGNPVQNNTIYIIPNAAVIKGCRIKPVYQSDITNIFLDAGSHLSIKFEVKNIEFDFPNGKKGLQPLSFVARSGNLVGIMGGSGAGKSTLLNLLNGNFTPSSGEIIINTFNLHKEKTLFEGVIGYVPQDDLLMEDLTVYQNLYFNSKLCFGELDKNELTVKVSQLLQSLGLYEIKDLKVGSPLDKMISGGQRKRLNIALEIIRAPSVLFVDEPTSGLSSLDSIQVMDLLKQLTAQRKLVFVVIHQPSAEVFKLFDKLLILDHGGYPVYYGNPVESLTYFKTHAGYADKNISECELCGDVDTELVFSIIEGKTIDEFGNQTRERKIKPSEWNKLFTESKQSEDHSPTPRKYLPKGDYRKALRFEQLKIYIQRDVLSKLRNRQYMLINLLEAPLLAWLLAYFLKYTPYGGSYTFYDNLNIPAFIFISVIVALFMGLSVSAEEIIRDRKILLREKFLSLSRFSYLSSKISVLFFLSAIQTLLFVFVSHFILGIKGMMFSYWIMLFTVSCFANVLGLLVSSLFKSAITVYILVPFLIIPQIILSGVMVKFENLNPAITSQKHVPFIGEIMASRWAFEGLAVNQFSNNDYERHFFPMDKAMSTATYRKDFWFQVMNDKLDSAYHQKRSEFLPMLRNELKHDSKASGYPAVQQFISGSQETLNRKQHTELSLALERARKDYIALYNRAASAKDSVSKLLLSKGIDLLALKNSYTNKALTQHVTDYSNLDFIIIQKDELIRKFRPVYMEGGIRSPYFVSGKNIFGISFKTYFFNFIIIWKMTLCIFLLLYFDVLNKAVVLFHKRK